jgi:hypothetical protein
MDVLCHKTVKSKLDVIRQMKELLKPGGYVLLNLPAYDTLKSKHDIAVHNDKRFSMSETKQKIEETGLDIVRIIYFNTILFPFIAFLRKIESFKKPKDAHPASDFKPLPNIINQALFNLLKFEASYIRYFNLPFGLSIMALARKKL